MVTNFCKIDITYITVITIIFAVIVVMIIVVFIINIVDVAFGYWSMMIWFLLILSLTLSFIINIFYYCQRTPIYVQTTNQVIEIVCQKKEISKELHNLDVREKAIPIISMDKNRKVILPIQHIEQTETKIEEKELT